MDDVGKMIPSELEKAVKESKEKGETPFYVNATAGTTVLGSFDPLPAHAAICKQESLWLHVDGSYGGPTIFSPSLRKDRLAGLELVDSFTITPHKMLGVPVTSSFLVVQDLRQVHAANAIEAEYLFHRESAGAEVWDLAHYTPQCGRKGDALKLFLGWTHYGRKGYADMVERAYGMATYLFELLEQSPHFVLVSKLPLPCVSSAFSMVVGIANGGYSCKYASTTQRMGSYQRTRKRIVN